MDGQTLVRRRQAATRAQHALHAANQLRAQAERDYDRARLKADHSAAQATAKFDELSAAKAKFSQLKRTALEARKYADKKRDEAEQAWKIYEEARGASAPAAMTQAKKKTASKARAKSGDDHVYELKKAAEEAKADADAAELEACKADTNVEVASDEMETLTLEHQELARVARHDNLGLEAAQSAFDRADDDLGHKKEAVDLARAEVLNITVTAEKLGDEWQSVSRLRQSRRTPSYLKIRVRDKEIDSDAAEALVRISDGPIALAQRERALRNLITRHGIASEVADVTKELNRRRRSEVQNRVLAATYFETLLYLMDDHTGEVPRPKTTSEIELEVKDTAGFVESVQIYQLEADNGPLKRFALELIDIVSTRKKIEIDTEFERNLLADQLRAQL